MHKPLMFTTCRYDKYFYTQSTEMIHIQRNEMKPYHTNTPQVQMHKAKQKKMHVFSKTKIQYTQDHN